MALDLLCRHDCVYSITSSARAASAGGTVVPSALALLRFMTNSNLVGWRTGRVFSFGETAIIEATMEGLNNVSEVSRFLSVEKTDHWDRGRLRTRPKRPQDRHSRERAEKIPALHVSQHLIQRDTPAGF
jgi:hypothetical protein